MPDIIQKLVKINEELDPEDITSIKFLCQDHIAKRTLSTIDDGLQIFKELEQLGKINFPGEEMDYLLECLYRCNRIDLIKTMGFNQVEVQDRVKGGHSNFSAFRILLFEIADDMDEKDFKRSRFISEKHIPGSKLGKIKSIHDLFIQLERSDILSPENVSILLKLCEMSSKTDLTRKVRLYQEKEQQSTGTYQSVIGKRNLPPTEPSTFDQAGTSRPVNHQVPRNDVITEEQSPGDSGLRAGTESVSDRSSQEMSSGGLNSLINQSIQQPNQQHDVIVRQMEAVAIDDSAMPSYKMNARPRGVAIIINNEQFKKIRNNRSSKALPDRIGSEKDAENLNDTWTKLGFKVHIYNNLDSVSMIKILDEASQKDHSNYDCLVVCILSHGTLGYVNGSDGISVKINRLTGFFSGMRSLVGKPKLFFLQACRGNKTQKGHAIRTNAGGSMPDEGQNLYVDGPKEILIPDEADFLLGYATVSGFVSYRKKSGSSYISILTNNLNKFADKFDLVTILTKVNEEVGQVKHNGANKQIPSPMFTLRKKVFFK